jgi:predicted branched-subunit amino acid permease
MLGALILAFVIVVVIPVVVMMSGPIVAALLGQTLTEDADERHEGSELVGLDR